jgi:hypothetical protein
MVDALRRAREFLRPEAWIIDIHPTAAIARIEVGSTVIGPIESGDAPLRHQAATDALESVVRQGLLRVERSASFDFYTYGDSIEELADYIEENWRNARVPAEIVGRARETLLKAPGAKPRILERVQLTVLR